MKMQNGPIKENGHNGIQIDDAILLIKTILIGRNEEFPCEQNVNAIYNLERALSALTDRKRDRAARGVDGNWFR